jgi:hypothetical protein
MDKATKTYWFADPEVKDVVQKFIQYDDPNTLWATNPMWPVFYRAFYTYYSTVIKPQTWESGLIFKGKQGELLEVLVPMAKSLVQQLIDTATKQKLSWMVMADSTAMNVQETARLGSALCKQITREQKVDLKWANSLEHEMLTGLGFFYVKWRTDKGPLWAMMPSNKSRNESMTDLTEGRMPGYTEPGGEEEGETAEHEMSETPEEERAEHMPGGREEVRGASVVDPPVADEQIPIYMGDVEMTCPTIHDVLFDPNICDPDDWEWVRVREIHNRWNLIAQFPDLKMELMQLPSVRTSLAGAYTTGAFSPTDDDMVYVYAIYHKPTPALPKGRIIVYGDIDTIMFDGDNFYGELPVYVSRGKAIPLSSYGDPFFANLIAAQEMLDTTVSAICTNNAAFAVQNVAVPRGSGIQVEQILGMNFFSYTPENIPGGGMPTPIQLTKSAPETFQLIEIMQKFLQDLSRINASLRGEPPKGVTSGTAIATLSATAIESVEAIVKASKINLKKAMMGAINCYRRFGSVSREVQISGSGDQTLTKKFLGRDLDAIRSVELQETNPLMQTQAGRIEISKDLMAQGLITNMKSYFQVLSGAPVEAIYEDELSEADLVTRENEAMMRGEPVRMINTDDHAYHIRMHAKSLNDPKIRMNDAITAPFLNHIMEHLNAARMMDPILMGIIATGKMPDPSMMMPAPPMPAQIEGEGGGGGVPGTEPQTAEAKPAQPADDLLQRGA